MARPTPVLPDVGSTMVPPGPRSPSRSAASIMATAGRSLTLPPGLRNSNLASSWPGRSRPIRSSRTSGVSPTRSSSESAASIAGPGSLDRADLDGRIDVDGYVAEHLDREPGPVQLLGDLRQRAPALVAVGRHQADRAGDVGAQVGDDLGRHRSAGDVHPAPGPGGQAPGYLGCVDYEQDVHDGTSHHPGRSGYGDNTTSRPLAPS